MLPMYQNSQFSNLIFPQAQVPDFGGAGTGQSPNNPYSRGGFGAGYPRPTAGYPQ